MAAIDERTELLKRIDRLRKRIDDYQWDGQRDKLIGLLKGILDLLADEL